MKKIIQKRFSYFGQFYMKHWKVFVGAKLVLLGLILSLSFSLWTQDGKVVRHGGAPIYADGSCGNGICETTSGYCGLSNDCNIISTGICASITGCTVKTVTTSSCQGTTFSCSGVDGYILDQSACEAVGCFRDAKDMGSCSNIDNKGKTINESCSTLGEIACNKIGEKGVGDCLRNTSSTDSCGGNIVVPTDENNCTVLNTSFAMYTVDITAARHPDYIEDSTSCPVDCGGQICGNGMIEGKEICDDGKNNGRPGFCNKTCDALDVVITSGSCVGYHGLLCSDGLITSSGGCENIYSDEGNQCMVGATEGCVSDISKPCGGAICGNATTEWAEECDDGNTIDGDGCSSSCATEAIVVDERCGNAVCDNTAAICELSNWNCNNIDLTACNGVSGCSMTTNYTYACTGSTFSCSSLSDQTICQSVGCGRSDGKCSNIGLKGSPIKETCESLSQEQCDSAKKYSISDCATEITSSSESCQGMIIAPENEYDCSVLRGKITTYGYYINWSPAYIENITSCPADCSLQESTCGNGAVEGKEDCDDGNTNDGDSCSSKCFREPGCSISMTGATNESPFTAYFSYELYANSVINYMQFDGDTSGSIESFGTTGTFNHEYTQLNTSKSPILYVYNANHPELTATCDPGTIFCSPFTPQLCGPGALGNRGFQCSDISQAECMFLIEIYQATSGENRENNNGWLQDHEACDRHGVTCTTTESGTFLVSLNLSDNNLQGKLPVTLDLLLPYVLAIVNPTNNITVSGDPTPMGGYNIMGSEGPAISDPTNSIKNTGLVRATGSVSFIGSGGKAISFTTKNIQGTQSLSKINLSDLGLPSIPFSHFTTLNLSHNHLRGTIPMGYTLVFPMLESLNLSYNDFSSVFGKEPLVSISNMPGYNELVNLANDVGFEDIIDRINNVSFASSENFRPYLVLNIMMQRFDVDHALAAAINKGSLDTLSSIADIMGIAPDGISSIWVNIYKYYQKNLLAIPSYMNSTANYAFDVSQELKDGFLIELFQKTSELLAGNTKRNNTLDSLIENKDIADNISPLITSSIQVFTNLVNHLQTVNFSHNSITTVPENLPLNTCISSFDLSYNQLNKKLPFVSYFGYNKGPIIQAQDHPYLLTGSKLDTSDVYADLLVGGMVMQSITHLKYDEPLLTGTMTGVVINDEKITTITTDHGAFQSQIAIPDNMPNLVSTFFGRKCIQSPVNGTISCGSADCKADDPKCSPLVTGQYVGIFAAVGDETYSSVCAYSGPNNGIRSYDPDTMTFDKDNICNSLGMQSLYDFNILRETVGDPVCDRTSEVITLDFSHNQLMGYLPEIVTTNSTNWEQLKGLTLGQDDPKNPMIARGPLRLFMQSSTPVTVDARLNDNNLTDDRQPDTRTDITEGELTNNCLTRPGIIQEQTTYLGNFREGWDDQRMCDLPRITYSPDQKRGRTDTSVTATVHLPEGGNCSISNNNQSNTYTFDTNGAFAFEVNCSGFTNPWFIIGKVNWINSNTTILVNAKDFAANLDVYESNTKDTEITSAATTLVNRKKMIAKAGMKSIQGVEGVDDLKVDNKVITTNNLNFVNDVKVYNPITITTKTGTVATPKISVEIPNNVILRAIKDNKETDYTKVFYAPQDITDQILLDKFLTESKLSKVINIIHVGSNEPNTTVIAQNENTQAIENFALTIETTEPVGKLGKIFSSQDGNSWTYYGTSVVIASGSTHMFYLTVPHLTYFGIGEDRSGAIVTTGSRTPAGSMRLTMDYCPDGDDSPSYYDSTCVGVTHSGAVSDTIDTNELRNAYFYGLDRGLISSASADARLYDKIRRRDLAKLIAIYAKNVVGLVPSTTRNCVFTDLSKETIESKVYIMRACRLGIMGVHKDGDTPKAKFDPNNLVTRAEFATVLSRLLYDGTYNIPLDSTYQWYELHMKALKAKGVIKNISQPRLLETKGFVLIMLQRADELIINAGRKK